MRPSRFAEGIQEPLFRNPIDAADEQFGLGAEGIEGERPGLEEPVGFFVASAEVAPGAGEEFVLDIESAAAAPIFQRDDGVAGAFMRDLARGDARRPAG